jgi:hypothetical protein
VKVPTVAFAFLSPQAIRIFLAITGYRVSIFTGEEQLFFRGAPTKNIVILPNFSKRDALAPYADQIGRHEELVKHGIPILDAEIKDGDLEVFPAKTPDYYLKQIDVAAQPLELTAQLPPTKSKKTEKVTLDTAHTLDQWLDVIDEFDAVQDFDAEINMPVCSYLVGDLSKEDLQAAMKVVVKKSEAARLKPAVKMFYRWLTHKEQRRLAKAVRHYMKSEKPASVVAKEFKVSPADLREIEAVFYRGQNED